MKKVEEIKFPNAIHLFKFCHRVLSNQKGSRINDQDVGNILGFNPSDCSHWKRGEKNVRSIFSIAALSETLHVEPALLTDIVNGSFGLDEAQFEHQESLNFKAVSATKASLSQEVVASTISRAAAFAEKLLAGIQFSSAPLYLPEIVKNLLFVQIQSADMTDRLTRVLRVKPGQYVIQHKKGDLKAQTRFSMAKDLARLIFEAERSRFPELGTFQPEFSAMEQLTFASELLLPKKFLLIEIAKIESNKNIVNELSGIFWVPKSLVTLQLKALIQKQ